MRSKQWASSENYSASPNPAHHQIKSYYVFVTNIFLGRFTEIYRHLLSKCFKKVVLWRQEMVQCKCFFLHQTETFLLENLYTENFFGCVLGAYYFQFQRSWESQNEWCFFDRNCIVKWVIFFTSFYWLWDFLQQNLEKTLMMSIGTCGLKLYARSNIFKKGITNMVQISFFGGLLSGVSASFLFFFSIFCRRSTVFSMLSDIFTQHPPPPPP